MYIIESLCIAQFSTVQAISPTMFNNRMKWWCKTNQIMREYQSIKQYIYKTVQHIYLQLLQYEIIS